MATQRRVKVPAVPIYRSKDEADAAIVRIAVLQRDRTRIVVTPNEIKLEIPTKLKAKK